MKRLINVVLAVVLLVGLYGYYNPGFAEDEPSSGQEQSENEGSGEPSGETPSNEQPPDENKVYACPKCGFTSDGPGDCPACNISLTESSSDSSSGSGESGSEEANETGGDSTAPTGDESDSNDSETTTPPTETEE